MNDIAESARNNQGIIALLLIVLTGGGVNMLSEGAEDEESEQMAAEFRLADIVQNEHHQDLEGHYDALKDLYHDLDKRLALMEQAISRP